MRKLVGLLFVCLLTAINAQSSEESDVWSEKIQLYGHGFSVPTDFTDDEFEYIANTYKVFTVEKRHAYDSYGGNPSTERATIGTAAKLKAINPDIEVLLYWNAVMNYETLYEYNAEFGEHPEWIHSIWSTGYEIYDLTNIDCRNWWVNSIVEIIEDGDLDGVFLDAGPKVDVSGLTDAFNIAVDSVRARIGYDKIVIYNGYRVASATSMQAGPEISDHTSGIFIEFFLHAPLDTKEEAVLLFDNLADAYDDGKMLFPRGTPSSYLPEVAEEDRFLFSFASFLLFYGPNSYWIYNDGYNKTDGMFDYYSEYYDKATGESLGGPQRNGWVYTRKFENASVEVDLENMTASINWIENPVDETEPIENLAVLGTATQSSTNFDAVAALAIDGDTNGAFGQGSVTHTLSEAQSWWQVDLGYSYHIGEISVFNRTDACCYDRVSDFTVYVLNADSAIVDSFVYTTYPDPSVTMDAEGVKGRYVKVRLNGTGSLTLAEVTVSESKQAVEKSTIGIKVIDEATSDSITLASLEINGLSYTSNYVGEFTLELPEGDYAYSISKNGYYSQNQILSVTKDTAIVLQLEAIPQYSLSYKITDASTDENLSDVEIQIAGESSFTNDDGEVTFSYGEDMWSYNLSKIGYVTIIDSLLLTKDTLLALQMVSENYTLTFQLQNTMTNESLLGTSISINDTVYEADAAGNVTLSLNYGNYDYVISSDGYVTISDILYLTKDSLVSLDMNRAHYMLSFQLENSSSDVSLLGCSISINDTIYDVDADGNLSFMLQYGSYDYMVNKEGIGVDSGSVFLISDSILTFIMPDFSTVNNQGAKTIEIYPNPVNDVLTINAYQTVFESYEIYNITGEVVLSGSLELGENNIGVEHLMSGMYLVQIVQEDIVTCTKILKRN